MRTDRVTRSARRASSIVLAALGLLAVESVVRAADPPGRGEEKVSGGMARG
jgi:hypothetical protein